MRLALLVAVVSSSSSFAAASDAPVSLTASDGTGLKLVKLQARAVVMDPLAFTELTLSFENPLDRVIEGQFKELTHGVRFARGYHEVIRRVLLQHAPHRIHIVPAKPQSRLASRLPR